MGNESQHAGLAVDTVITERDVDRGAKGGWGVSDLPVKDRI